ncbi:MAG: O-antigen ligase family protein [Flavobacteriales bacterium]
MYSLPTDRKTTGLLYLLSLVFILTGGLLWYYEFSYFQLLPFALLLIYTALFKHKQLFLFVVFCTPLSLNLEELEGGISFFFPTEPLLFGIMLLLIFKYARTGFPEPKVMSHPLALAIYFYLGWLIITVITSVDVLVSFKSVVARVWFIIPVFFFGVPFFSDKKQIYRFVFLFLVSLCIVVIYTVIHHSTYAFGHKEGHWVMWPFFKDHTSYGAVLAMFFPIAVALYTDKKFGFITRMFILGIIGILALGIILSYTRAAWVSLAAAAAVWFCFVLRIKFKYLLFLGLFSGSILWSNYVEISHQLQKNRTESSKDLGEHVQSISNVSSDASNLERLNRWNSALRMFKERPIVGWGPGTYAMHYAPFQHSSELTIISTNFGDLGNAHSEYLGPLAETGFIGLISVLILISVMFYKGGVLYIKLKDDRLKKVVMGLYLGLVTYFTHGILNNYWDTDKAAVPIWGFVAIFTAIELYHNKSEKSATE